MIMEKNQANKTGEQSGDGNREPSSGQTDGHATASSSSNPDMHERNKKAMPGDHGYNGGINPADKEDEAGTAGETGDVPGEKRNPAGTSGPYGYDGGKKS